MRSRPILAASPSRHQPTPVTVRRKISPGLRPAASMAMWRPAGPRTLLPARPRMRLPARPSSTQPAETPTRVEAMHAKIKAGGHASPYRLRKQLPEPVFGQIKQARGFRKVRAEGALICTAHNLLKLANGRMAVAAG